MEARLQRIQSAVGTLQAENATLRGVLDNALSGLSRVAAPNATGKDAQVLGLRGDAREDANWQKRASTASVPWPREGGAATLASELAREAGGLLSAAEVCEAEAVCEAPLVRRVLQDSIWIRR